MTVAWPSTTGIIKFFGLSGNYDQFSSETAMQRGRLVTAGCHMLAYDESDPQWEARHPECHGYLDAYRKFQREHLFRVQEVEPEYRSEALRFVSRPDQIGTLDTFGLVDLELKSGTMPKWCPLQTAGQVLAMKSPGMRRFGLLLRHDGNYQLFPHDDFRDLDRFRAMVETYWTIREFRNGNDPNNTP